MKRKASYDVERLVADMTLRGWNGDALAKEAGVSKMTVSRFLSGEVQTAKTAKKLAAALQRPISRYFVGVKAVA